MRRLIVQLVMLAGLACTLASCVMVWFAIPIGADALHTAPTAIEIAEPGVTVAYRVAAVLTIAALVISWKFGKAGTVGTCLASLWLAALLTYPYAVMVRDAAVSGDAAWLEAQHRNLVRSTGDLSTSTGVRAEGAFDDLVLTRPPRDIHPIEMTEWLPSEFSFGQMPDLVDRLGYSDKFFEFIRLGWVAALIGGFLMLMAICAPGGFLEVNRAYAIVGVFSGAVILFCTLGWSWAFFGAADLADASRETAAGNYDSALSLMQQAQRKLPALREDTYYIAQTGLLEDGLRRTTPASRLYRARLDEKAGKSHRANETYEDLALSQDVPPGIRREACRALLHSAIDALNSGRTNASAELLEKVLLVEPCNLKANYALQLAYLRTGQYEPIPKLAERLDAVYHYFQYGSKKAVVSASYQNALVADAALGNIESAVSHSKKVVNP